MITVGYVRVYTDRQADQGVSTQVVIFRLEYFKTFHFLSSRPQNCRVERV